MLQTVGSYRVVRLLGVGGMAQVFEGVRTGASGFEKRVAIKMLRDDLEGDAHATRLLIEEAKLGARVNHQNLVKIDELDVDQGRYFVVMELVEGADLATLLDRNEGPLAEPLAVHLAQKVALGLAQLHRAVDEAGRPLGLVHRDVSPHNILVSAAGEVKLADFGIAKATLEADETQQVRLKGKIAYMSPEQADTQPLDPRTDVFSLGVTLAEMLIARRPYEAASAVETLELVKAAAPVELPGVSAPTAAVVLRATARSPDERYTDAHELYRALADLDAGGDHVVAAWVASVLSGGD